MKLLPFIYEKATKKPAPYYLSYSPLTLLFKPIRKWLANTLAANCPLNCVRVGIYRLRGFRIGEGTFIGMRANIISRNADKSVQGVTIGENAVIGACTLVNQDVPDGKTAVGVPCRIIDCGESL